MYDLERFLGTAHRWVGLGAFVLFLTTGLIMRHQHLYLLPLDSGLRLLFRSRHIYLLFGALLNVAVSLHYSLPPSHGRRGTTVAGSMLVLASPFLLALAFFREPVGSGQVGPLSGLGVLLAVLGIACLVVGAMAAYKGPDI